MELPANAAVLSNPAPPFPLLSDSATPRATGPWKEATSWCGDKKREVPRNPIAGPALAPNSQETPSAHASRGLFDHTPLHPLLLTP